MTKKVLICANCGGAVEKNFGSIDRAGNLTDLCSFKCRAEIRTRPRGSATASAKPEPALPVKKKPGRPDLRPRETDISKAIGDDLDLTAAYQSRLQSGAVEIVKGHGENAKRFFMQLCRPGTPDRIAADGLIIFFEIKKPGEIPSAEQKAVISNLRANGALVFVVDNTNEYDFIRLQLKKRKEKIEWINAAIRGLQNEIDMELERKC